MDVLVDSEISRPSVLSDSSLHFEHNDDECEWKQITIDIDWGKIRGKCIGKGTRKILAIHGWLDNANSFDMIIPYILNNCMIVSIDLPGHGWSEHFPTAFIYDKRNYVAIVKKVIKELGWNRFTFMGHSMGAAVGIFYSAVFPEDVDSLISIDIIKPWSLQAKDYAAGIRENLLKYFKYEEQNKLIPLEYKESELIVKSINKGSLDEKAARILMERSTRLSNCGNKLILNRDLRTKAYFIGFVSYDGWIEFAKSITCPILIIKAKDGHKYESEEGYKVMLSAYSERCQLFRYEEVEGKHHAHLTNYEIVGPIIKLFLDDTLSLINGS